MTHLELVLLLGGAVDLLTELFLGAGITTPTAVALSLLDNLEQFLLDQDLESSGDGDLLGLRLLDLLAEVLARRDFCELL